MARPLPTPEHSGEIEIIRFASFVYQGWSADGDLLYVGVTDNIYRRLADHDRSNAEWLHEATRVTCEQYASREDALRVESSLIRSAQPKYNRAENWRRLAAAAMGHRRMYADEAWSVLAAAVRERREVLRITQTALARSAGIDVVEVRSIERAEKTAYPASLLTSIEAALDWHPSSIEAVLRGEAPGPFSAEEIAARARAEAHAMFARRDAR